MAFFKRSTRNSSNPNKTGKPNAGEEGYTGPTRLALPRGRQVIGVISQRLGAGRMYVSCMDGKTRNCRVPGRLRRSLWLREGNVVIVEPWEFDNDKADVLYKYVQSDVEKLKNDGLLKTSDSEF